MWPRYLPGSILLISSLVSWNVAKAQVFSPSDTGTTNEQHVFTVRGEVKRVDADGRVLIHHDAIPGYMDAMTMPFNVKAGEKLKDLRAGDQISFRFHVTDSESWIDHISIIGTIGKTDSGTNASDSLRPDQTPVPVPARRHPLLDFKFTNECDQPVCLSDFHGQALAITFFFTRCPVPDFCPRLSRNFQEASSTLASLAGGPTNWHFLSITFDPTFDTAPVLKAYAERYHYDPAHWSFLTGPVDKINELARLSGVQVDPDAGLFNHNFRTLIINAKGDMQTTFPFGGNLSEPIVAEMLKACAASGAPSMNPGKPPTGSTGPVVPGGKVETEKR